MVKTTRKKDDELLRHYLESFGIAHDAREAMQSVKPASTDETTAAYELALRHYRNCRVRCIELYSKLPGRFHDRVPKPPEPPEVETTLGDA